MDSELFRESRAVCEREGEGKRERLREKERESGNSFNFICLENIFHKMNFNGPSRNQTRPLLLRQCMRQKHLAQWTRAHISHTPKRQSQEKERLQEGDHVYHVRVSE